MAVESVNIVLNGVDNASATVDKVNQKLVSSEEKYISKLKEQLIALEQGTLAAERFKLEEMGFSEETINAAMALKQQIEAAKEAARAQDELEKQTREATEAQKQQASQDGGRGGTMQDMVGMAQEFAGQVQRSLAIYQQLAPALKETLSYITGQAEYQARLNTLMNEHQRQVDFNLKKKQEQLQVQIDIANLQGSEAARRAALLPLQDQVNAELEAQRAKLAEMEATAAAGQQRINMMRSAADALGLGFAVDLGLDSNDAMIAANILEEERKRLAVLEQQKEQLDAQLKTENEQVRLAREKAEAEQRRTDNRKAAEEELNNLREQIREVRDPGSTERERQAAAFEAAGVEPAQRMELELLQDTLRTEQELAAERQRNAEREKQEYEARQNALVKTLQAQEDYLAGLRQQNLELTVGAAEAERQRLQAQGFSEEVIQQGQELKNQNELLAARKQLADEQKKIDEDNRRKLAEPVAPVQAVQSRLLSRVNTGGGDRVAKASEKTAALTEKIEALQREQLELEKKRGTLQLATLERA